MKLVPDLSPLGLPWRRRDAMAPPALFLDFAAGRYAPGGFGDLVGFTRASTATYVDAAGGRQTAAVDAPRFTHDPASGAPLGLLIEESRTNLLLNSDVLATQDVTVTAQPYTLSFTGSGTVTLSGASTEGPLTGTGAGEANRVSLTFTPTAGTLTLTVSGSVSAAQLEAGATASSYIPTAAAAVTRAADTAVIPAARLPWPLPVVIGDELVPDAATWTGSANWSVDSGTGTVTVTNASVSSDDLSFGTLSTTSLQQQFLVGFDVQGISGGGIRIGGSRLHATDYATSAGSYSFVVHSVLEGAGSFVLDVNAAGVSATVSNISVREIAPLAVSLQIDGLMSYADEDAAGQVQVLNWAADSDNRLLWALDTASTNTGQVGVSQTAAAVADISVSASDAYAAGALVPFSIAGRHGSTFVQGAADGVVFTADATPVALPELAGSDLQLAPGFNGTIKRFRMWRVDIGGDGIGAASA